MPKGKKEEKKPQTGEIVVIDDQLAPLKNSIARFDMMLKLATPEDMLEASDTLSKVNTIADALEADKKKITAPLNEAIAEVRSRYKQAESYLKPLIERLRKMTGDYQTRMILAAREEEAKIASRVGDGKGKLKVETAVRKMGEIEKPLEKVVSASGSVSFREDKVLKITNQQDLLTHIFKESLFEYIKIDDERLLYDLKSGKTVPGAEIEIRMVPINRRG